MSSAHQELADFIKHVHIDLRLRSRDIGPGAAWNEHCANKEKLEKYAMAMQELASVHWEKNYGENSEQSRIFWVLKQIDWYFRNNGRNEFLDKEKKLAQKYCIDYEPEDSFPLQTVSLLDVGSCYDPFSKFPSLDVTAVDLSPAHEGVLKCDFLSVLLGAELVVDKENTCVALPKQSYDAVIFSLFLEYLPSPRQRFASCSKASRLLKAGGLLIVLTPDSKHDSANSKLLKNWRLSLASLGFILIRTEKLKHLRGLLFAKSNNPDIPKKWLSFQNVDIEPEDAIAIPQDYNPYDNFDNEIKESNRSDSDNKFVAESFSHLSVEDIFS